MCYLPSLRGMVIVNYSCPDLWPRSDKPSSCLSVALADTQTAAAQSDTPQSQLNKHSTNTNGIHVSLFSDAPVRSTWSFHPFNTRLPAGFIWRGLWLVERLLAPQSPLSYKVSAEWWAYDNPRVAWVCNLRLTSLLRQKRCRVRQQWVLGLPSVQPPTDTLHAMRRLRWQRKRKN